MPGPEPVARPRRTRSSPTAKCSISGRLTRSGWCQQGPSNSHVEPLHEESRTTAAPEQALLPQRPEVANRSCRYRGDAGLQRWVGLGVIADNLIHIGRFLAGAQRIEIERRAPKEKRKKMKKKCQSGRNPGLGSGLRSSAVPMFAPETSQPFRVILGGLAYRRLPDQKGQNYAITLGRDLSRQNQKEPGSVRTWP